MTKVAPEVQSTINEMKQFQIEMRRLTMEIKRQTEPAKIARQLAQQA